MRVLIVLLALCNAALLAWGLSRPPAEPTGPPPPGGNLVLLSEAPAPEEVADEAPAADEPGDTAPSGAEAREPTPELAGSEPDLSQARTETEEASTEAPVPEAPPEPTPVAAVAESPPEPAPECHALTPSLRPQDARRLAGGWREQGYQVAVELITERQRLGYWVYLPSVPSLDEARETMARLRRAGIEDYALVGGGGATNIVSLGLFDRRAYAESRLRQMRQLGFAAEMGERDREVSAARLTLSPGEQSPPPAPEGWNWQTGECPPEEERPADLSAINQQ